MASHEPQSPASYEHAPFAGVCIASCMMPFQSSPVEQRNMVYSACPKSQKCASSVMNSPRASWPKSDMASNE